MPKYAQDDEPFKNERSFWKGAIGFGLVQIPITLHTAERADELHFRYLVGEDLAPIKMERVHSVSGVKVAWKDLVKGYEVEPGVFVVLQPDDFKKAATVATQSVDIAQFVDASELSPALFSTQYYVAPQRLGVRAYVLLREALRKSGRVGIATVVLRTRQHLAALRVEGPALVLQLLHYAHELRPVSELVLPPVDVKSLGKRELHMAQALIESMVGRFDPAAYRDAYRDDLLAMIEQKRRTGAVKPALGKQAPETPGNIVDIVELLERSVAGATKRGGAPKPAKRAPGRRSKAPAKGRRAPGA